jgi:hypothetical protein
LQLPTGGNLASPEQLQELTGTVGP